jgi:hypothetical protein
MCTIRSQQEADCSICCLQIQIYLPENQHPAAGLVRTVVKDSTDLDTTAFMDSDGHYNDNSARTKINGNPANDGAWHMVRFKRRAVRQAAHPPAAGCKSTSDMVDSCPQHKLRLQHSATSGSDRAYFWH